MDAEFRVMKPQAKDSLESPEAGRSKVEFSPRAFRGSLVLSTPRFQIPGLPNWEDKSPVVSHSVCGH